MEITKETKASDLLGQYEELKSQVSRLGEKLKTMKDEDCCNFLLQHRD